MFQYSDEAWNYVLNSITSSIPQLLQAPQNFTSSKFCSDIQILLELIEKARSEVGTYTTTINEYGSVAAKTEEAAKDNEGCREEEEEG